MGRTAVFTKQPGDVRVEVTYAATQMIGLANVAEFVKLLTTLMEGLGANRAYVCKRHEVVDVWLLRQDGWQGHMRLKK